MLRRFLAARKGVAAIEFAIILPLLMLGFFGAEEVSSAVQCSQKVSQTASTVADLVAQASTISTNDENNIYAAANAITFPYSSATPVTIVISSIVDAGSGRGVVAWSDAQHGSARAVGSIVTLPTGVMTAGGSVIMAEIRYTYAPPTAYVITGNIQMSSYFYSRPRRVPLIIRT